MQEQTAQSLMKFLANFAHKLGVGGHTYVVGGAVRNHLLGQPIKDVDLVVDAVALGGRRDSEWFAQQLAVAIPASSNLTTNQYGVAILTVTGSWILDGVDLRGEVLEIANARKESYTGVGGKGKGYKPDQVEPATIQEDVLRREFTFNCLLWRLGDLREGPAKASVIDLTGLGQKHLAEGLIQTPVDPDRVFSDDPTRMLRAGKFFLRLNLRLSPEVAESIRKNAPKLKQMPWEAVSTIFVRDILDTPRAREGLVWLREMGLLQVLTEMIQEQRPFAAFMAGHMTADKDAQLLLDLAELGFGDRVVSFLSSEQRLRVREITMQMSSEEATRFLEALKVPSLDNLSLIEEFQIPARERGKLAKLAREVLLRSPALVAQPELLSEEVRGMLR